MGILEILDFFGVFLFGVSSPLVTTSIVGMWSVLLIRFGLLPFWLERSAMTSEAKKRCTKSVTRVVLGIVLIGILVAPFLCNPQVTDKYLELWYQGEDILGENVLDLLGGLLFAVEPNHGELDKITPKGKINRVIDISASQGHIVPTSVDYYHGHFYVGNLETFPIALGGAKILEINPGGKILSEKTGLTNIVSAIHDKSGNLYVLESTTGNPTPTPDTGVIVRINANGEMETIASGLSLPTAMTFGPDGALFVSNKGFGYPAGMGEIVRVELQP